MLAVYGGIHQTRDPSMNGSRAPHQPASPLGKVVQIRDGPATIGRIIQGYAMRPETPWTSCLTICEAANYLRVSRALFYKLVRQGHIKTIRSASARSCASLSWSASSIISKLHRRRAMKSHNCLDCGRLLCSRLCDQPSASDLDGSEALKLTTGADPREFAVKYPTDNRCQRCGGPPSRSGYRLILI